MGNGTTKSIKDVRIGDYVEAGDTGTGRTSARPVTALIRTHGTKHLVRITVSTRTSSTPAWTKSSGPHGHQVTGSPTATIDATTLHPFWIANLHRWTDAAHLTVGMWLRTASSTYVQITALHPFTRYDQTVNNLTVESLHTYYVLADGTSVLVHNSSRGPGCEFPDSVKRQGVDRNLVANDGELRCEYCDQPIQFAEKSQRGVMPPGNELAYDHFVPVNRGGKGTLDNLVIACRVCNTDKSDQEPFAWLLGQLGIR